MSYFLLVSGSQPILNVVLTSSFGSNNKINFSASLVASRDAAFGWSVLTQSITSFNSLTLLGNAVTTSLINQTMTGISASTGFNLPSASNSELANFISGSNIVDLFASCSINLV